MSTTLTMPEPTRRARPEAMAHNASALRALAQIVRDHAEKIDAAAALLNDAGDNLVVKLNHRHGIDAGLTSIRSLIREVEEKVDSKKFAKLIIDPPAKPKRTPKRP